MTVAAGYRLSSALAWLGGALNLAAAVTLWGLDVLLGSRVIEAPGSSLAIFLLSLSAGAALAVLVARRTETLVHQVAAEAGRRLRTASRLEVALYTQHDVRSLIASATLNAGLLRKRLEDGRADALEISQALEGDLDALSAFVNQRHDSLTTERPIAVVTAEALARMVQEVHRQVPGLEVRGELRSRDSLAIAGGEQLMRRLLLNLLVNAAEGDGRAGATRCVIRSETDGGTVRLVVEDDGPGFAPELLHAPPAAGRTTKARGSGLGLSFVRWVVEDSGGALTCANHARGARVTLALPKASAPTAGAP
jgi:signal transduction histidine kinase